MSIHSIAFAVLLLAVPASAQVAIQVGPDLPPVGCPVNHVFVNHTPSTSLWDPASFRVFDAAGALVYQEPSAAVAVGPFASYVTRWPQVDAAGQQVASGTYFLGSPTGPPIVIGGSQAAIAPAGARTLELCAPSDPGALYVMAAARASGSAGFQLCGNTLPLVPDDIFRLSLNRPGLFQGFAGTFDANGQATATINVPPTVSVFLALDVVFVVLDPAAPCGIGRVSSPLAFLLL